MLLFSACSSTQLLQSVLAWCNKTCYQCSGLPHNAIHSDSKVIWKLQRSVRSFKGLLAGLKDYLGGLQPAPFQTPLTTLVFNHVSFFQEKGKAKIYLGKPKQAPHWSRQWLRTWNSGIYLTCIYMYVSMYHLFCVCHTLVPEINVRSEMFCVFQYVDMNHIHDCQDSWTASTRPSCCLPWKLSMKIRRRRRCTDTWYKQI